MARWKAGAAEGDITPPPGCDMTGYANRPGCATHILDRLAVRALALADDGGDACVLVGLDLLGIDDRTVDAVRAAVAAEVPAERLLLNSSHTHAGPTTGRLRSMGAPDPAYVRRVVETTAATIRAALADLRPASLAFGTAECRIGSNRRELRDGRLAADSDDLGTHDPALSVLRVEDVEGRPLACWFSHACHSTIMGNGNTGLSGEWPGVASRALAERLGCLAIFAQGCSGDINPRVKAGYDEVLRAGREAASAAERAWQSAVPLAAGPVGGALETVWLPQGQPSIPEAEAALERSRAQIAHCPVPTTAPEAERQRRTEYALLNWAEEYVVAARDSSSPPVRMEAQVLRIGDVCISAVGAEAFTEIGRGMRACSALPHPVSLGYTNGCYGYLPTAAEFPLGGYEIDAAFCYYGTVMVTPDCERLTFETVARLTRAVGA